MWNFLYKAASPKTCYRWVGKCLPILTVLTLLTFSYGLVGGLFQAPADYQQGDVYRIIFIHVPSAAWSLGVYVIMSAAALIALIWKIKIADMVAKLSAPIGASFTLLALVTGSIWGEPTWGTWWIWDARLTSELILMFIYGGIIVLRSSMPEPQLGSQVSNILTMVGLINIPIIHFSVNWWQTLHQGPTLLKFGVPSIASAMLYPLLAMIVAFFGYYLVILLTSLRYELLKREQHSNWIKDLVMLSSGNDKGNF